MVVLRPNPAAAALVEEMVVALVELVAALLISMEVVPVVMFSATYAAVARSGSVNPRHTFSNLCPRHF